MNTHLLIRKSHRYLGVFIGIQFLMWTMSGIYFSWNDIDNVHGDHMRKSPQFLSGNLDVVAPSRVVENLKIKTQVDSIHSIHLINVAGKATYQISYFYGHAGEGSHPHVHYALAEGQSGKIREQLSKEEAVFIAKANVLSGAEVKEIRLLEKVDKHHEFRERPLPAWAISFTNPDCTVYISAELGTFQTIRHDQWRAFDLLYMFHTMDYEGIDDFNNWLLKILSVLGVVTVLLGFALFFVSSRTVKKLTT
jgi:hypothetical protein